MLNNSELRARIDALAADSIGSDKSSVSTERADALDRYHGRLYGDEMEGRSKIVSRDLMEAVDWVMPSVMRPFFTCGNLAEFHATGPEDVDLAEQETDYTNHVILQENNGFLVLHDVFKDALILKNGYAKSFCDYSYRTSTEEYTGLTMDEATALLSAYQGEGAEVQIVGQEERLIDLMGQPVPVIDLKLRITRTEKRVCIEAVPPEEMRISKRCRGNLNESDYIEHRTRKTRTALIEMGMGKDFVYSLPGFTHTWEQEESARHSDEGDGAEYSGDEGADPSMDEIEYRECYVRIDYDEDGKAELRKVVIVGKQIPPGDEWNHEIEEQPFSYAVPKRMPHRHLGESLHDDIGEIAEIKTILTRGMLDNTYGLIHAEWLVNERVNLDDFLVSRPLGVKRVEGKGPIGDAAAPVVKPNILDKVLPALEMVDRVKENRTGVRPAVTGIDPDALKEVRSQAYAQNLNQANAKIEMVARMFAETFVKDLVLKVHGLLVRHQDKAKVVRLRNKFVTVDPRSWKHRMDCKVNVGLGTGTREDIRNSMQQVATWQQSLAQLGLVGPKQAFNSFTDFCKGLGLPNPEAYCINPDPNNPEYQQMQQMQAQQQAQNPLAEAEKVKAQANMQIAQMREQGERERAQLKAQLEHQKQMQALQKQEFDAQMAAMQLQLDQRNQAFREFTDTTKAKADLAIMAEKARSEQDLVEFKEALAKKALEAEIATLEVERERIKSEVLAAQDKFRQQEMARIDTASKSIDEKLAGLHASILQELANTVAVLSRPRKTRVLATDSDGIPIESVSELT